jgi:hypothetical protein
VTTIATRPDIAEALRKLGVETVTAPYDGYGDSGQIEDPEFGGAAVPNDVQRAVTDLFYDVLEERFSGWETNEGSFGRFVWDVPADRITLEFNARVETVETEELVL